MLPPGRRRALASAGVTLALLLGLGPAGAAAQGTLTSLAPYAPVAAGLQKPRGVAVTPNGNAYISDENTGLIHEVTSGGATRVVVSGLERPQALVVEDAGHLLVLAERLPAAADGSRGALLRVDVATGAVSVLASGIKEPHGLFRRADGAVFLTAKKLVDLQEKGVVLRYVPGAPLVLLASGFTEPQGIVAYADGSLVVAAERHDNGPTTGSLFAVDPGGNVSVLVPDNWKKPAGVALDATGALFVSVRHSSGAPGAIVKRRTSGAVNSLASGLGEPAGLAFAPDGDLLAADSSTGIVWRFDAPAAPSVDAPDPAYTNQNPYALGGTAQAGAQVQVTGGAQPVTATAGTDGAWSASVTLSLNAPNALSVTAVGAGGQGLASVAAPVQVVHDGVAPTVGAAASPAPNAAGWNNADVTVTFTCDDGGSGIASCTAPVVVTAEGAGQSVSGTAVDRAGNTATATLAVSLDKTPPAVAAAASPSPNGYGWNSTPVTVAFVCDDALSGVAACPAEQVVDAEGAGQAVTASATDAAGNSASAGLVLNLDLTPPSLAATPAPAPNERGWNNSNVTVSFEATDALSGLDEVSEPEEITDEGRDRTVFGSAADKAGNVADVTFTTHVDKTPPVVTIVAPAPGEVRRVPRVELSGTAADENELTSVSVAGVESDTLSPWSVDVVLEQEGPHTLTARAEDVAGNVATASLGVVLGIPPVVTITSPTDLAAVGSTPVTVTGTVDDPDATIKVGLEAVPAVVNGNSFSATGVPLREGGNVVTAAATDPFGNASSASITVVLDTTAPRVLIDSPQNGSVTTAESLTVTGRINDLVLGTVNSGQAQVSVNGVAAEVANRTFIARDVPLLPGSNAITATATDAVGNSDAQTVTVLRADVAGPRLSLVSGDAQSAGIGDVLAEPLTVAVRDGQGLPLAGRSVVFRVAANNGELIAADGSTARGLVVQSDADGLASLHLQLGTRAGVGNNRVEATSPGVVGAVVFTASGTAKPADKISVDSGGGQIGAVDQPLPRPFVAVVTDAGSNRLGGVPVTFAVAAGGGLLAGGTETTVVSDSDGRALAVLTLGPRAGAANNVVTAAAFGLEEQPATFTASAVEPGDPLETSISGVVLDNSNVPIPGVTLRVRGTALAAAADAQGQFRIQPVPVGNVHLQADGTTAQRPGTWPSLEFEIVTVPGADNTLGMPIYLVQLDTASSIFVDETTGGTLALPDYPGFSLTVAPNSATFPDGTRRGTVSVTSVHVDKVPMVPNFGQQPRFIVTIQPPGVHFDPPAAVTHPNVDGLAPGEVTEIYSFDHDMGSFVATGTATVSEDGTVLRSDPGMGIVKGGWHCGGNPSSSGTPHNCPECKKCNGSTCVNDDGAGCDDSDQCTSFDGQNQGPDKCQGGSCQGKKIEFTEVTFSGSVDLPDGLVEKVNNALRRVPGLGSANLDSISLGSEGKVSDCCEKATGVISQGFKEVTASLELSAKVKGLTIWGPPTISKSFFIPIPLTSHAASIDVDLQAGIKVDGTLSFSASGGRTQDQCKGEDCAFGEVTGTSNVTLKATAQAIVCVDATWSTPRCSDLSITPASFSFPVSVSGAYNRPCDSGFSGKISMGKIKFKATFGLGFTNPTPENHSTSVEAEGWKLEFPFQVSYSKTIFDGLEIPF